MSSNRILIKLGGASLQDETVLEVVTEALRQYRRFGYQVILVHGGGPAINAELTRRGIEWNFIQGQRVTTPEMMDVIEMVLSGSINRKLVKHLSSNNLPALGFSGVDGQTLLCSQTSQELGLVGTVEKVQAQWIEGLLSLPGAPIPVMAPLGTGSNGESFNINADWAASRLASALKIKHLIFLTDQTGILDTQGNLIKELSQANVQGLIDDEVVTGGMYTKTLTILHALKNGVSSVRVMNGKDCLKGLWSDLVGTWCLPETLSFETHQQQQKDPGYAIL
jgi:acetylglutamate kinase